MTYYFVSRHQGAIAWAKHQALPVDVFVEHLDLHQIKKGDIIAGSLPVNMAAQIHQIGAEYWHLTLPMQAHQRGVELSAEQLQAMGAKIERFVVEKQDLT